MRDTLRGARWLPTGNVRTISAANFLTGLYQNVLTVVLPEFVPAHWWEQVLHNQTALRLKAALLFRPGIVVADVPHLLRR